VRLAFLKQKFNNLIVNLLFFYNINDIIKNRKFHNFRGLAVKRKNGNNIKQSYILTRETLGMTILLFSALVLIILLTNRLIFAGIGGAICTFMYGTFGYGSYLVVALCAYLGEWLVFEKSYKIAPRTGVVLGVTIFMIFLLFHTVSTNGYELNGYGKYIADCYYNAANGYSGYTFGGVISALFVYPIAKGTTFIGAYVIFSILLVLCLYLSFLVLKDVFLAKSAAMVGAKNNATVPAEEKVVNQPKAREGGADKLYTVNDNYEIVNNSRARANYTTAATTNNAAQQQNNTEQQSGNESDKFSAQKLGRKILFENGEFAAESYRRNMIFNENSYFNHPVQNDNDYLNSFSSGKKKTETPSTYSESYSQDIEEKAENVETPSYIYGDTPVNSLNFDEKKEDEQANNNATESYFKPVQEEIKPIENTEAYIDRSQNVSDNSQSFTRSDTYRLNTSYEQPSSPVSQRREENKPIENNLSADRNNLSTDRNNLTDRNSLSTDRNNLSSDRSGGRGDRFESPITDDGQDLSQIIRRSREEEKPADESGTSSNLFSSLFSSSNSRLPKENNIEPDSSRLSQRGERSNANLFDDNDDDVFTNDNSPFNSVGLRGNDEINGREGRGVSSPIPQTDEKPVVEDTFKQTSDTQKTSGLNVTSNSFIKEEKPAPVEKPAEPAKPVEEEKPKHVWKKYVRPTLDLLDDYPENTNVNTAEIEDSKQIIIETLSNFRIASQIANVVVGPAITRYDVIIEDRTNIKNALKYKEAIAMALMKENVTAYLNYSKGAISIEVPNSSRTVVGLKGMLASSKFINSKPNTLTFTLGKNVEGQVVCPDITKMPHLLVAGTTGSGKSICLSTLIVSLLYKYGPEELRFILVDPKQVEFISYDKLPHLMINEIIYDVDKAIKALNWAIKEMERRYQLFKEMTEKGIATKNLTEYNAHLPEGEEKLPKIVIILDEFGDLMLQAKKEIESRIIRLVQKARACGIHLILATQRPSVDCITGLIKSNLPTRIGFKVNSFDDARTIFDIGGAEKLLGKGDMYYRSAENPELARIQGCFIDTHEVQKVTDFIKKNNETYFDQSVSDFINTVEEDDSDTSNSDDSAPDTETKIDDTFIKALKFCVTSNQASVSMIQRRFPVGYIKACKIIDWMENMNYVTQAEGSKPRKVLLSKEEFFKTYGDVDD
jgi:DNA segregation ATPase FtsK/SpoIIIE-like protein